MLKFILKTDKPVAVDSPDFLVPHGTKLDNSKNQLFNKKLYTLFGGKTLHILDLGCSGGGFVKDCIDDGHIGIGLEGSDYSKKIGRAEWRTIPKNLFTCDIAAEFSLKAVDENSLTESEVKFDAITAWEFIEHIKTEDLPKVCNNVIRHLKKGGVWIMSVSPNEEVIDGMKLHQTVENQEWWENFFHSMGFRNHPHLVNYFGQDWVRGHLQGAPGSFHFVLTYGDDEPPAIPSRLPYDGSELHQTGVTFFRQGVEDGDAGSVIYAAQCFEQALKFLPDKSEIHYARAVALFNLKYFTEAQAAASSVLALEPNHAGAHALLAAVAMQISAASVSQSKAEFSDSSLPEHINLREVNFIVFPDWSQPEESLSSDLAAVIKSVLTHPDRDRITLLLDTTNIPDEEASLILSGILMNLLLQEDLSVDEEAGITLLGALTERQWETLLPHIHLRIALATEDRRAIAQSGAENLPYSQPENLHLNKWLQDTARSNQDNILTKVLRLPNDWHKDGTLTGEALKAIFKYANQRQILHSVETGCGVSTLLLSHLSQDHKVFALAEGDSMSAVRSSPLLNETNIEFIEGATQKTLLHYKFENKLQLALIDGPHGYPFADLEYYFIYPHLEENAILILDDIHIPNLYNLFAFLKEDEMFELMEVVGTTAFFRRTNAPVLDPFADGWWLQTYNKNRFPINLSP
jgi:SAM-dependent methyltransferase